MIKPLSKKIYEEAKQRGVETIELKFQGGCDEGYLDVVLEPHNRDNADFEETVENWVWEVYRYSGADDSTPYGDNITYDLVDNTVSHEEWYMVQTSEQHGEIDLEIEKEE